MKRISTTIAFTLLFIQSFAQVKSLFLRHDTSVLNASECNWLIPAMAAQSKSAHSIPLTVSNTESTVSEWFLSSIYKGRLKAIDPFSEKLIPAKLIYVWGMPTDTTAVYDKNTEKVNYVVLTKKIQPEMIDRIRVQQDWKLDLSTGKIFSRINWVELLIAVNSSTGDYLAHRPFCRIYY